MSEEVKFSARELIEMYSAIREHVGRNGTTLDSMPLQNPERNQIMEQNKTLNGALRKLKTMLVPHGINVQSFQGGMRD